MVLAVAKSAGGYSTVSQLTGLVILVWAVAGAVAVLGWIGRRRHSRPVRSLRNMGRAMFLSSRKMAARNPSLRPPSAADEPPPSGAWATGVPQQPPEAPPAPLQPAGTAAVAMAAGGAVRQASKAKAKARAASTPPSANDEQCSPDEPSLPETLESAEARVGHPLTVVCPFTLTAQDRTPNGTPQRWAGQAPMWLALDEQRLWFLYGREQPAGADPLASAYAHRVPEIGGVWDVLPRAGLVLHAREHQQFDQLEMSWPAQYRLIAGELHGPAEQRRHLTGLLAADQFGLDSP